MSQQVQIDYKNIACQCNTVCKMAEQRLEELDKIINELTDSSTRLLNNQTEELRRNIIQEKDNLINQINIVKAKANRDAEMGLVTTNNHDERYENRNKTIEEATKLENMVNNLSSEKIIEYRSLIENLLVESTHNAYNKFIDKAKGIISINDNIENLLNTIEDSVLKQFTYIAYIKDDTLEGASLLNAGQKLMDDALNLTYEQRLAKEEERIRKELEAARVDKDIIDRVTSKKEGTAKDRIAQMQTQATTEIIGETVRQQSLKVIIKAISDRGFIVDKKNIKINRETNEVHMVAMKASGERADFIIYMDGKFIYDFHHGYQGQACQKDIEPFMKDLEDVYGIHVTKTKEIWSNPDKISTMKYQAMNTNKNKG